jgi:hypothetical protein
VPKNDFGLKPIRRINAHHLTAAQKANRVVRCRDVGKHYIGLAMCFAKQLADTLVSMCKTIQ